jgi:hypothetical protein
MGKAAVLSAEVRKFELVSADNTDELQELLVSLNAKAQEIGIFLASRAADSNSKKHAILPTAPTSILFSNQCLPVVIARCLLQWEDIAVIYTTSHSMRTHLAANASVDTALDTVIIRQFGHAIASISGVVNYDFFLNIIGADKPRDIAGTIAQQTGWATKDKLVAPFYTPLHQPFVDYDCWGRIIGTVCVYDGEVLVAISESSRGGFGIIHLPIAWKGVKREEYSSPEFQEDLTSTSELDFNKMDLSVSAWLDIGGEGPLCLLHKEPVEVTSRDSFDVAVPSRHGMEIVCPVVIRMELRLDAPEPEDFEWECYDDNRGIYNGVENDFEPFITVGTSDRLAHVPISMWYGIYYMNMVFSDEQRLSSNGFTRRGGNYTAMWGREARRQLRGRR